MFSASRVSRRPPISVLADLRPSQKKFLTSTIGARFPTMNFSYLRLLKAETKRRITS
jgi:hypothetical protein